MAGQGIDRPGEAGMARRGEAWRGRARHGEAGLARLGAARRGGVRQANAIIGASHRR